jgi:hypothetical protein
MYNSFPLLHWLLVLSLFATFAGLLCLKMRNNGKNLSAKWSEIFGCETLNAFPYSRATFTLIRKH